MRKKNRKINRVLVDMSCALIHHGHIRLIKKARKYGKVFVALTSDKEIKKTFLSLFFLKKLHQD